jgi:hypothetical protein
MLYDEDCLMPTSGEALDVRYRPREVLPAALAVPARFLILVLTNDLPVVSGREVVAVGELRRDAPTRVLGGLRSEQDREDRRPGIPLLGPVCRVMG